MDPILVEADTWIKKAEKCLKPSLLRRSPDYDKAVECYTNAAQSYRKGCKIQKSAEMYMKVAELLEKVDSYFQAAKNYETASTLYKEADLLQPAVDAVFRAGELLQKCGSVDSATSVYARAAKSLEYRLPAYSAQFYEKAAETCNVEEKYHESADFCHQSARLFVRLRQKVDAQRLLRVYIGNCLRAKASESSFMGDGSTGSVYHLIARASLVLILLELFETDEVAAGNVFREAITEWKFNETEEGVLAKNLISAFEQRDPELLNKLLQKPVIRSLDLAFTELVEDIKKVTASWEVAADDQKDRPCTHTGESDTESATADLC